ncbi:MULTISPECIES: transaldolase [Cyanophyceae]|jgi:transaldolase|uniref:transaldolase n=1 Tax=Cyanophyceae TaxID=3028117 RepID=UPI00016DCC99|nr:MULTISPECIES: transaldolase [Cyanophyceae]ACA99451.1 transaldolase [Picosynechococcus sp. PCC 7002]SMH30860.1 transaldolase [Picosynechococcus sp. OG1]SMQ83974.1 transaldolase [Synechococcus sp. 7002]
MATANPIIDIEDYGQSIWMDNLSRDLITSGELAQLIDSRGIHGITSNPAIFEKAIAGNEIYDEAIKQGIAAGKSTLEIYESIVFEDISNACDIFAGVYEKTDALDGYVSIEVPPNIAKDTESTIKEARRYFKEIGRPNVMIKIPGTPEGLPAVTQAIAEGINVNVTLLFSVQAYIDTAWAYIEGLEKRAAAGEDISKIASVASFFLSRIDVNIDNQLDAKIKSGVSEDVASKLIGLKGKVAIANAKIAYQHYLEIFSSDRWQALAAKGAKPQRLLWASTGTKNPDYSDVMYVDELVGADTVNTLPPDTIEACADHCDPASRITANVEQARQIIAALGDEDVAIDLDAVMAELLEEGIEKFIKPFESLMDSLETKVKQLATI